MKPFNTDKYDHGYLEFYEPFFKKFEHSSHIMEIGIYHGGSLEMLRHYFKQATLHGVDINDYTHLNSETVRTYICDQEKREDLEKAVTQAGVDFDIILDDGGHTMKQQQVTFGYLFQKVRPGGLFILEDLHTSRLEQLGTILPGDLITTLDMLYTIKYTGNVISNYILDSEKEYIEQNVKAVHIWTRTEHYNQSVTSIIEKR